MAARARRGPAPIASFDHDPSDESSPETKQSFQLPEIREDPGASSTSALVVPEGRARSHSSPGLVGTAPRIDISRASSSSHHDSRDSSPELALFAGAAGANKGALGFGEDGALDLRSSTEELAFLEGAPGGPPPPPPRRHSRKDSQGSEAALPLLSGRTSRLSSVGSACSAASALSALAGRISRLSVVSGASRSPSPHKLMMETSFCGPRTFEPEPEDYEAAVGMLTPTVPPPYIAALTSTPAPGDARDHREVCTQVTLESAPRPAQSPTAAATSAPSPPPASRAEPPTLTIGDEDKPQKESRNRTRVDQRRARSRERRDRDRPEPEVYKKRNRSKDVIRIRLKPDHEYDDNDVDDEDDDDDDEDCPAAGRATSPSVATRPTALARARTPSPGGAAGGVGVARKASFCSLFRARSPAASPDAPAELLRRKKSLTEGRSKSRDRERAPPSPLAVAARLRGSVLALFRAPRRSVSDAPSPSPLPTSPRGPSPSSHDPSRRSTAERLKYYEDGGIIHIPLRTPPDEESPPLPVEAPQRRPASAPSTSFSSSATAAAAPATAVAGPAPRPPHKPIKRTVLPDGSIIIPLHSPTEKEGPDFDLASDTINSGDTEQRRSDTERPEPSTTPVQPAISSRVESIASTKTSISSAVEELAAAAGPSPSDELATPGSPATTATTSTATVARAGSTSRRARLVFTTNVGSTEQVFSTQFSITKTPSVGSEISESVPSLVDEVRPLRDTHISGDDEVMTTPVAVAGIARDSSESDGSSEAGRAEGVGPAGAGGAAGDAEARGLVVQESFEEELPYVPTTLPLERPLALPMVPVRERSFTQQTIASVQRPRASSVRAAAAAGPAAAVAAMLPAAPPPPPPRADKLRIRLPRRPRAASAPHPLPAPPAPSAPSGTQRHRTSSATAPQHQQGGEGGAGGAAGAGGRRKSSKTEWIDFSEVPERRKQPKRIQTLPAAAAGGDVGAGGDGDGDDDADAVVFSYVPPDECRCECHHAAAANAEADGDAAPADDELPLIRRKSSPAPQWSPPPSALTAPGPSRRRP